MESQLNQAGTYAAQNYADSFFRELPTDSRYIQVSYQKYPPNSSLDSTTLDFTLNRFTAANVYQIQNTCLEIQIVILKSDNTLPTKDKNVSPVNNILHSFFESVRMKINDEEITKSKSNYPYKAYITNTLSYATYIKSSQLQAEGYYSDLAHHMGPTATNVGFTERNKLFRKNGEEAGEYKSEGARFFGKLHLDLMGCPTGLIPGTKVDIELERASDDFFLLKEDSDTNTYKVKLISCFLYVPVAQLSSATFSEIERVLVSKSVAIHYRKIEIRTVGLYKGKEEYNSENLFLSDVPCRIVICFIESKNRTGSQKLNPFDFKRSWSVTVNSEGPTTVATERERYLEKRLVEIEKQLGLFKSCMSANIEEEEDDDDDTQPLLRNKGKGKKKSSATNQPPEPSIFSRLRNSFSTGAGGEQEQTSDSREPSCSGSIPPPAYSELNFGGATGASGATGATKKIFIKKVELLLNGSPLDQIEARETGNF